jgi:guanidinoacetate N-methyltransferase
MAEVTGYHSLRENQYGGDKAQWKKIDADYKDGGEGFGEVLKIDGHPVMEEWEKPYMGALAKVAASKGGKVLEVGFGLGLSATAVQSYPIEEHLIIEANDQVIERGKEWATKQPHKVTFLPGLWQEVISTLPDNSVDGILYDTYPLTKEEQHVHQFDFIKQAHRVLKPGGILTYCNLTSIGVLLGEKKGDWESLWNDKQVPHLNACGFDQVSYETFPVTPPDSCEYYGGHKAALVPTCIKGA